MPEKKNEPTNWKFPYVWASQKDFGSLEVMTFILGKQVEIREDFILRYFILKQNKNF